MSRMRFTPVVTVSASGGQGKSGREMRRFTVPCRNCPERPDARKADPSWSVRVPARAEGGGDRRGPSCGRVLPAGDGSVYLHGVTERWRDVAHIGHAELLTPTPEASLEYFTALLGLTVVAEQGGSWYLRGYGDDEPYCLKLTASASPRARADGRLSRSPEALARRVSWLKDAGRPRRLD